MHLVHVFLDTSHAPVPDDFSAFVMSCARADEGIEHVTVHADERPVVLGLFVAARSPDDARRAARAVAERAAGRHPGLAGASAVSCRMPLTASGPGRTAAGGLLMPPPDQASQER
ncbi:hypothetical protein ACMATS_24495 [Streptoverticillium reticulum]|uniref:hypothetical protein n=1 Tax=Streptoverticillium reticulum TaxID=1433415 RepID=UPI0039BF1B85